MFGLHMPELIIVLVVALLIFGPKKLPEMGSAIGKSIKEFRKGVNEIATPKDTELSAPKPSEVQAPPVSDDDISKLVSGKFTSETHEEVGTQLHTND